uniref:Ring finger protein 181 n=1 Tax=Ovis aries TaxID=9940 RepID=A0AC11AS69_SHEEP
MASYFDEHDCEPLDRERDPRTNMLLELARSLFNRMDFEDLGLVVDWDHHLPPPAAKTAVENLPRTVIRGSQAELKCPVCLLEFEEAETAIEMPCHHLFHSNCILPWLSKTNSCPLCRHELPTDDDTYEEHKRDKGCPMLQLRALMDEEDPTWERAKETSGRRYGSLVTPFLDTGWGRGPSLTSQE